MKSIALNSVILLLAVFLGCAIASDAQEETKEMVHPLLGLVFDPTVIKYERPPLEIIKVAYAQNDLPGEYEYWIVSMCDDSRNSGNTYFMASGLMLYYPDVPMHLPSEPGIVADDSGVIVVKHNTSYKAVGTAFEFEAQGFPQGIVRALADDAVDRAIRAYGSVEALQKALDEHWNNDSKLGKEVVRALKERGLTRLTVRDFK